MFRKVTIALAIAVASQSALAYQPGTPLALLPPPPFVGNVNGSQIAGLPLPAADINCVTRQAYQNGVWGDPVSFIRMARASVAYASDNSGNWTSAPASVTGVGGGSLRETNLGCLSEVTRTNYVPNSSMAGGSAGTAPTGWSAGSLTGVTVTISAPRLINGINTVTFNYQTGSGFAGGNIFPQATGSAIAVSSGQVHNISAWVSATGIPSSGFALFYISNYNVSGNLGPNLTSSINGALTRYQATGTVGGSNTTLTLPLFNIQLPTGANNFSLTIGWPQLENFGTATTPIVTSSGAVTQAADVGILTAPLPFGPAFTGYVSGVPNDIAANNTVTQTPMQIDEGDNNSRWDIDRAANNAAAGPGMSISGTAETTPFFGSPLFWTNGTFGKGIFAVDPGAMSAQFTGTAVATAPGAGTFAASRVAFGWGSNQNHQFDGNVRRIEVWPTFQVPASIMPVMVSGSGP